MSSSANAKQKGNSNSKVRTDPYHLVRQSRLLPEAGVKRVDAWKTFWPDEQHVAVGKTQNNPSIVCVEADVSSRENSEALSCLEESEVCAAAAKVAASDLASVTPALRSILKQQCDQSAAALAQTPRPKKEVTFDEDTAKGGEEEEEEEVAEGE